VVASCWFLWLIRNDTVFDKYSAKFFLQVLFRNKLAPVLRSVVLK